MLSASHVGAPQPTPAGRQQPITAAEPERSQLGVMTSGVFGRPPSLKDQDSSLKKKEFKSRAAKQEIWERVEKGKRMRTERKAAMRITENIEMELFSSGESCALIQTQEEQLRKSTVSLNLKKLVTSTGTD